MTHPLKDIMKQVCVIDTETTINASNPHHFGATPFDPANSVVMVGWNYFNDLKTEGIKVLTKEGHQSIHFVDSRIEAIKTNFTHYARLLVGHNIPFDLHHLLASATSEQFHKIIAETYIWDTMIAEYYLSRQECKSISLENLAARYGIPFTKDETVSEAFKLGIGADKLDPDVLKNYLIGDVDTTTQIFIAQQKKVLEIGGPEYVEYLIDLMGARLTTMLMERNGCHINEETFRDDKYALALDAAIKIKKLEKAMTDVFGPNFDGTISISSPKQVHAFLFGGDYKTIKTVDTGEVYKTGLKKGQIKYKTERGVNNLGPAIRPDAECKKLMELNSVDSKVLLDVLDQCKMSSEIREFIEDLLKVRTITKDLSTYETYSKQFYPSDTRGMVVLHPNFNHALTHTKRPSCNQPNLQNVSNKDTIEIEDER